MRLFVLLLLSQLFSLTPAWAEGADARFHVRVYSEDSSARLTVNDAMRLALPTLWQRVVPRQGLKQAAKLKGRTSLVLQFKADKRWVDLVFNPVQVQRYLAGFGVAMITPQPKWDLDVQVIGFGQDDANLARELMNYSYAKADKRGFLITPNGRKLNLIFQPAVDVYGESVIKVDVQGAFTDDVLVETQQVTRGYLSYQLQVWLEDILLSIRDAYSLSTLNFKDTSKEVVVTIESNLPLTYQVALEEALVQQAQVVSVVPVLLQKMRKQYRIVMKDSDDTWLESWFSVYGMTAVRQPLGSSSQWLVQ